MPKDNTRLENEDCQRLGSILDNESLQYRRLLRLAWRQNSYMQRQDVDRLETNAREWARYLPLANEARISRERYVGGLAIRMGLTIPPHGVEDLLDYTEPGAKRAVASALGSVRRTAAKLARQNELNRLLADLNLREGWDSGSISITVGSGTVHQNDLTNAMTIGDVISPIESGTTAGSLGINISTDGSTLRGSDIRSVPDRDTLLSDISSLAGNLPLGSMDIVWEGGVTNLNLGSTVTLGDIQDQFATAIPGMEITLLGGYLQVVGPSSDTFTIRDGDASRTATALGISGEGTPSRMFGIMEDLQANLSLERDVSTCVNTSD